MSASLQPLLERCPVDVYGLPLTTTPAAAGHYLDGIARLILGDPAAELSLRRAVDADPRFALAHAALDLAAHGGTHRAIALGLRAGITRRERQHIEILAAYGSEDDTRATALAREHILEFPKDLLIVREVAAITSGSAREHLFASVSSHYPGDPLFWALRLSSNRNSDYKGPPITNATA